MTYDTYKASGCEYPGDDAPDDERDDDADGVEENDMQDIDRMMGKQIDNDNDEAELYARALNALGELNETRLASLQNAIDLELRKRLEHHTRAATAAKHALERTKPRATRKDAGKPRERKEHAA